MKRWINSWNFRYRNFPFRHQNESQIGPNGRNLYFCDSITLLPRTFDLYWPIHIHLYFLSNRISSLQSVIYHRSFSNTVIGPFNIDENFFSTLDYRGIHSVGHFTESLGQFSDNRLFFLSITRKIFIDSLFPLEQIQEPCSSSQTFSFISKKTSVPVVSPARSSSKSIWFEFAIGSNENSWFVIGGLSVGLFVEVARNWSIEIIAGWGNAQLRSFGIHLHSFALKYFLSKFFQT